MADAKFVIFFVSRRFCSIPFQVYFGFFSSVKPSVTVTRGLSLASTLSAKKLQCHFGDKPLKFLTPFSTAVPFLEQTTQISSSLSPKRDCASKRVEEFVPKNGTAGPKRVDRTYCVYYGGP